jgi:rod shape-determining protein MreC
MRFIYTKTFAVFFGSLAFICLLLFMDTRGWLTPVRTVFLQAPRPFIAVVRGITVPTKNFISTIYRLHGIVRDDAVLTQKVGALERDVVLLNQYKLENEALKRELGFVNTTKFSLAPCTVIVRDPLGLTQTAVLNCGTDQGVSEGQAVLSQGYLVGKILIAYKNTSTALLINNSRFTSDVKVSQTGAEAVAQGSFSSGVLLDRLPQNASIQKGWLVVSAGIDPKIPSGILVGEIGDTLSNPNELFKRSAILSPINLDNLRFVMVVK